MEMIHDFLSPELAILTPVLYIIGMGLKSSLNVKDTSIPIYLTLIAIVLALVYTFSTATFVTTQEMVYAAFTAVIQGILYTGLSVYANQLVVQHTKAKTLETGDEEHK